MALPSPPGVSRRKSLAVCVRERDREKEKEKEGGAVGEISMYL